MYLKYHFGLYIFRLKALVYAYHSCLDNIGCTSLDRSIDGISFGISAHNRISGIDIRKISFTAEYGFNISLPAGKVDAFVHIFLYLGISFEIAVY